VGKALTSNHFGRVKNYLMVRRNKHVLWYVADK